MSFSYFSNLLNFQHICDNPTLNRFFSLHYLLPFVLGALALVHVLFLHVNGSNNPLGISSNIDKVPLHPYFSYKDFFGFAVFGLLFSLFLFFAPNYLGQWMAVLIGNSQYYYSTICWNDSLCPEMLFSSLGWIIGTQSVSELYLPSKNYVYRYNKIPSLVKIQFSTEQSAGNFTGSSETTRATSYESDIEQFSFWLAGLIDGDGSLLLSKKGLYPSIEITLHKDDVQTLFKIKSILNLGSVSKRSKSNAYRWRVHNREGVKTVIRLINGKLLTPSKQQQLFKVCNVLDLSPLSHAPLSTNNAWFSGFFDAEGYLSIRNQYTLTLSVGQKHIDILSGISKAFNAGNIYFDKSWNGYNFCVTDRPSLTLFMNYFQRFPLLTTKNVDLVSFRRLLLFLDLKYHHINSPYKTRIDNYIVLFKNRKKI